MNRDTKPGNTPGIEEAMAACRDGIADPEQQQLVADWVDELEAELRETGGGHGIWARLDRGGWAGLETP